MGRPRTPVTEVKERPASPTSMIPSGRNGCVPAGRVFKYCPPDQSLCGFIHTVGVAHACSQRHPTQNSSARCRAMRALVSTCRGNDLEPSHVIAQGGKTKSRSGVESRSRERQQS